MMGRRWIGATTCIPLEDETADVRKPFEDAGFDISTVFYFRRKYLAPERTAVWASGIAFLMSARRMPGLFGNVPAYLLLFGSRGITHPLKPENYRHD